MWNILFFIFWNSSALAHDSNCDKISSYLKLELGVCQSRDQEWTKSTSSASSIFVSLKEQANLDLKNLYSDSQARRRLIVSELVRVAQESQVPIREFLSEHGVSFTPYYIHNMIRVDNADSKLVIEISRRAEVERIFGNPGFQQVDMGRRPQLTPTSEQLDPLGIEGSILSTGANKVWSDFGITGAGITVAGQDTGVQWDHPALIKQYRGSAISGVTHTYNWFDAIKTGRGTNPCGYSSIAPCDDDQHGTHTMGTIVGYDGGTNQIGMAPGANWIACRNMDKGYGTPGTYIDCFQFFLAPYPQNGDPFKDGNPDLAPHVMNNSWGCPVSEGCRGDEMIAILKTLMDAGIFVVASAGNDGPSCFTIQDQPAGISDYTFSVGAHDHRNNRIAGFSSRGPSKLDGKPGPDVTAPGVSIRSSIPGGSYQGGFWSGTSMSGPHVVGLVALVWSANPKLIGRVNETAELIRQTADPTTVGEVCGGIPGSQIPNNTFGYGRINALRAVEKARELAY